MSIPDNVPDFMNAPTCEVSNDAFIKAIFRENWQFAHITGFFDDPSNIEPANRGRCWAGGWYPYTPLQDGQNQYFTISVFNPEQLEEGGAKAVRRKNNFVATYCIVADDVKDKVPEYQAALLPPPSWKLETSPGNEQWGWILTVGVADRGRVDNLLDGLVSMGLAPDGTDPGMKGVTRYVRLPEGWNTKAKYGRPFKCRMVEWNPDRTVTLEELAAPFGVDLNATRSDDVAATMADVEGHPIIDGITVLDVKGPGEYLVECPWIDEHTDGDNSGTILYTHTDGSIGFKCHHGHCQDRTGGDLLEKMGLRYELDTWKAFRKLQEMTGDLIPTPDFTTPPENVVSDTAGVPNFLGAQPVPNFLSPQQDAPVGAAPEHRTQPWEAVINQLPPDPTDNMQQIRDIIRVLLELPPLEHGAAVTSLKHRCRGFIGARTIDQEITEIRNQVRAEQVAGAVDTNLENDAFAQLCADWVYVAGLDRFVNIKTVQILPEKAFRNRYCHLESELQEFSEATGMPIQADIIRSVLNGPMVKVDEIDYFPAAKQYYWEDGKLYLNLWTGILNRGVKGDYSMWLKHFDTLGINEEDREHMLDWMACTLQYPGVKINHILMLGGREGIGKDFLLYPMTRALSEHSSTIQGGEIGGDFNEFLLRTKHLHINELEAGNKREKTKLTAHLKPVATAPPDKLNVNQKGISKIKVRNIVNVTAATNDRVPLDLMDGARRYYMVWSDACIRGDDGQMTDEWRSYWASGWGWMRDNDGWLCCVDALMNRNLDHFDPRAVPRVTEYQKEVVKESLPALATYMQESIHNQTGVFSEDLVTVERIFRQIQLGNQPLLDMYGMRMPSKQYIGRVMQDFLHLKGRRVQWRDHQGKKAEATVYVLNDARKYDVMNNAQIRDVLIRYRDPIFYVGGDV